MTPEDIAGDGVLLVPVAADRIAAILAGDLDGRVAVPGWPHADTAPALSFAAGTGITWLVVDVDGGVVGEIGTKAAPDAEGRVEIGYGLAGSRRGRGLGTRAVRALVDWLRRQPDVGVIEALVVPANEPSVRLLRRLDFVHVGNDAGEDVYELRPSP